MRVKFFVIVATGNKRIKQAEDEMNKFLASVNAVMISQSPLGLIRDISGDQIIDGALISVLYTDKK